MDFFRINKFVHRYAFPQYDYILKNKSYFEEYFESKRPFPNGINNAILGKGEVYNFLNNSFLEIVSQYYLVSPLYMPSGMGIYKQTNTDHCYSIHNHASYASLTAVLYIDPPPAEEGGGVTFYFENFEDSLTLTPQPGYVYFIPGWLYHTPEPQTSSKVRISINWGYLSQTKPIHKVTGDLW